MQEMHEEYGVTRKLYYNQIWLVEEGLEDQFTDCLNKRFKKSEHRVEVIVRDYILECGYKEGTVSDYKGKNTNSQRVRRWS